MKISATKKAAILATVLSGLVLSNSANAANIAAVGATNYSSTDVGLIEGSYVTSAINTTPINAVLTGYNGDTAIFNMVDGKNNSVWIRQYTYSQTNLVPNVNVDSQGDWNSELQTGTVSSAPNGHNVATKNGFVYIADYDMGTIGVGKIVDGGVADYSYSHTVNIKEDLINYGGITMQHDWAGDLYAHGESILVDGNDLYVLANIDTYDASTGGYATYFEYANSYLIKYTINKDGTLNFNSCAEMGKNPDRPRINKYNDHIFATAIGGFQSYGSPNVETSLNVATIDKTYGWFDGSKSIVVPSNVTGLTDWNGTYGTEFRNLKIMPNGTAYVLCYSVAMDGYSTSPYVFKTTVSNLLSEAPVDWEIVSENYVAGWFNDVEAEYYTKRLWIQEGNLIKVYLDGATEPIIFNASDFASDSSYFGMQSWALIKPDTLAGNIAKLREGESNVENDKAVWRDATVAEQITGDKTFSSDTVVSFGSNVEGDLNNNILSAIYAKDGDVTVTAGGNVLQLQVENTVATPVGIYAGNGKTANVTANKINIITKGVTGGNSLNNAIMLDATASGTQSTITVNGDVNINMTGGYGGNGVAIQKTDRWGEASYSAENEAKITINGDLAIKGADNQTWGIEANKENVFSRFNNAGILTSVEKGKVIVNGNVDMDVYGNGVTTNAKDSSVVITKGGQITIPQGTEYGYYALAAYQGDITMNMGEDGKTIGTDTVTLDGDVFTLETGSVTVALTTAESELNGIVDNGGTANVYLQNGATWNNVANNERYWLDNEDIGNGEKSRVTNFYGGNNIGEEGVVVQTYANELTIDNYSGNTYIIYGRDSEDYSKILGGDVNIKSATEGSTITLRTDNNGIDTEDSSQVNEVMNNMANKLYYTGYINKAQDNLFGFVEIAEGLTAASVAKELGFIDFSEITGQGSLSGYVVNDGGTTEPENPDEGGAEGGTTTPDVPSGDDNTGDDNQQGANEGGNTGDTTPEQPEQKPVVEEKFEGGISGDLTTDETYKNLVNEETGALDFSKLDKDEEGNDKPASEKVDSVKIETVTTENDNVVINSNDAGKSVIIDMANKDLTVSGTTTGEGKQAMGIVAQGAKVEIQNAGNITIEAKAENGSASAIYVHSYNNENKASVEIDNAVSGGTVELKADSKVEGVAVLHAGKYADVSITGKVDITDTKGKLAVNVGEGSIVTVGGGVIGDEAKDNENSVAIKVHDGGKVEINKEGKHDVVIHGDIVFGHKENTNMFRMIRNATPASVTTEDNTSFINLTTADSKHVGNVVYDDNGDNTFNATITNGAQWTGNSIGGVDLNVILTDGGAWTGYHEDENEGSALNMQISGGAIWDNTSATSATIVTSLQGGTNNAKEGFIKMSETVEAGLSVDDYSGTTTFIYNHDANNNILGGDVTITKAADGSIVNVRTGSIGTMDKAEVAKVLNALAAKLYAGEDAKSNLKGQAQIAEGFVTSSNSMRFGDIEFTQDGKGIINEDSINYGATKGDYETAMMKGAKSAMVSSAMMWRAEANDLMKRMGDLRMAEGDQGIWAKYYGTKQQMEAQNAKYTNSYKAYQLGYDKKVGDWTVGVAASYGDGESTYANGRGDNSVASLGVYGSWNGKDGQYVDLIMKRSKLDNEYTLNGNVFIGQIEADYETWATSISAEYGKRFKTNKGFYVEPSAELTLGRVEGENYNTSLSATGDRLNVQQDDYDSLIGRLGLRLGQKLDKASYYAKLAVAKEFAGDFDTKYATLNSSGSIGDTKETSMDFGDTWYELQIGGTAKLNDNSYIYASYERNFGADVEQKWRVDAGLRFSF